MSTIQLHHAFVDESGDVAPFSGSHVLVVAALSTIDPRSIDLQMKRVRQSLCRSSRTDELKASDMQSGHTERLLKNLTKEGIEIVVVIVNKASILRPPLDLEEIYRRAVTRVVRLCVQRHPHLEIWFDKRYTNVAMRNHLERVLRAEISTVPDQLVLMHQDDSWKRKGLQAVDHIAWAFFQKYERANPKFASIVAQNVVAEEIIECPLW